MSTNAAPPSRACGQHRPPGYRVQTTPQRSVLSPHPASSADPSDPPELPTRLYCPVAPLTNVAPFVATFQITDLGKQISRREIAKGRKWTRRAYRLLCFGASRAFRILGSGRWPASRSADSRWASSASQACSWATKSRLTILRQASRRGRSRCNTFQASAYSVRGNRLSR